MSKKDLGDSTMYTIANYIMWFCVLSFIFNIVNLPALFLLIFTGDINELKNLGIIGPLTLLTIGPSIAALLYTMGKLIRDKDIKTFKTYFKGYKICFKQSIIIWSLELILIIALLLDAKLLSSMGASKYLVSMCYGIIVLVVFITTHMFPIISRFDMSIKDAFMLSFIYSVKKFFVSTAIIALIVVVGFLFLKFPTITIFFGPAIVGYLIMLYEDRLLFEIEQNFINKNGKS